MADYNTMELMITTAARELEDGASVGVGTGAPTDIIIAAAVEHGREWGLAHEKEMG